MDFQPGLVVLAMVLDTLSSRSRSIDSSIVYFEKATRIEVLGMVLLIALLIWRFMERSMRLYLDQKNITITR